MIEYQVSIQFSGSDTTQVVWISTESANHLVITALAIGELLNPDYLLGELDFSDVVDVRITASRLS